MFSVWLLADGSIRLEQQGAPMLDEAECKYVHEYLDVRRGRGGIVPRIQDEGAAGGKMRKRKENLVVALLWLAVSRG